MIELRMLFRSATLFAGLAALAFSPTLFAQEADRSADGEFIMNAWSDPADCNHSNAKRVAFSVIAAGEEDLLGECVAVEGYWLGRALFHSAREAKATRSNTTERLPGNRVGIYAQWERVGELPDKPTKTLFVGRLGQCETQWPGAIMVMGYCHYTGGPILLVSEALTI